MTTEALTQKFYDMMPAAPEKLSPSFEITIAMSCNVEVNEGQPPIYRWSMTGQPSFAGEGLGYTLGFSAPTPESARVQFAAAAYALLEAVTRRVMRDACQRMAEAGKP